MLCRLVEEKSSPRLPSRNCTRLFVTKWAHAERATITRSAPITALSHLQLPLLSHSTIKVPEKHIYAELQCQKTTSVSPYVCTVHSCTASEDTTTHTHMQEALCDFAAG